MPTKRKPQFDLLEYIQKKVWVDFDNAGQTPVAFSFGGEAHSITQLLGRFRTSEEHPPNAFLVRVQSEAVYFLYFHYYDLNRYRFLHEGYWVLCFRILCDHELMALYREDRKMLLNMNLKRVVDFHGHLCPDLVIGGKLCEYVQKLTSEKGALVGGLSIITENTTSALDAIQILLGATVGNQRLLVMDFGKHHYTLLTQSTAANFNFRLKPQHYGDEARFSELEHKMINDQVLLEDVVEFQKLLDGRVLKILAMAPEALFDVEGTQKGQRPVETASVYLTCDQCGHQMLQSRKIDYHGKIYCIPCFQRISRNCHHYSLH